MVKVSAAVAVVAIAPCLLFMAWGVKDIDAAAFTKTTGALRFRVWGLGFEVWGLGFGVWGLRFGVWGLGFGV